MIKFFFIKQIKFKKKSSSPVSNIKFNIIIIIIVITIEEIILLQN